MDSSLSSFSDQELVSLMADGKEDAFSELYSRYWKKLYNEAYKRLGDIERSKDVIQDVFVQFWLKHDKQEVLNIFAYLRQAVRYQVILLYHQNKNMANFSLPLEILSSETVDIESVFFARELQEYVNAWMELLPERRREIFRMRYIDDLTTKEISDRLGISQKTVQKTLLVALSGLRDALGKLALVMPVLMFVDKLK